MNENFGESFKYRGIKLEQEPQGEEESDVLKSHKYIGIKNKIEEFTSFKSLIDDLNIEDQKDIDNAFESLFTLIRNNGEIITEKDTYEPEYLISVIKKVTDGELDLSYITRTNDLRETVEYLLKQKSNLAKND